MTIDLDDLINKSITLSSLELTEDDVLDLIEHKHYHHFPGTTLTDCAIVLKSGFTITGESSCVNPDDFVEVVGREYAFAEAVEKLWAYAAYSLREKHARRFEIVEAVARAAHEVNRVYCMSLGDMSQPTWEDAPDWQIVSCIKGVLFLADNPDAPASSSHESWLSEKIENGWVYGPEKNPDKKQHPCILPFEDLPPEQQTKDHLFKTVVLNALSAAGVLDRI